jgi:hypothetical protein
VKKTKRNENSLITGKRGKIQECASPVLNPMLTLVNDGRKKRRSDSYGFLVQDHIQFFSCTPKNRKTRFDSNFVTTG